MKILLTNDDGIYASGLRALYHALAPDHEVFIVAPETEMSAVGHAITLTRPLRVQEVFKNGLFYGYAVTGTPTDCVKIGVQELLKRPPDIILSGINLGANVGINVLYSGTVSAATEGAFLGVPSAAISLGTRNDPDFNFAGQFSKEIIRFMAENPLGKKTALNVNIPPVPPEKITGISITRQGTWRCEERFERRNDPRGNVYYWLAAEMLVEDGRGDTDVMALRDNKISITPIHCDLTSERELARLRSMSFAWEGVLGKK
jgi:5'-nucleotidase